MIISLLLTTTNHTRLILILSFNIIFILSLIQTSWIYYPIFSQFQQLVNSSKDNISIRIRILTTFIITLSILTNYKIKSVRQLAILNLTLILRFVTTNFLRFFIIFERTLIPTIILIILYGYQPERLSATIHLIIYTIVTSLPLLISILYQRKLSYTSNFIIITISFEKNSILAWAIVIAFIVKTPLFIVHQWLPKAHVEAPVAGSIVLAGILLKLGSYALIRIAHLQQTILPTIKYQLVTLGTIGAIMASFICLRQTDLKCLIAYSSVSHIGLGIATVAIITHWRWSSTLLLIIRHGLASPLIFFLANSTYITTTTRSLPLSNGLHIISRNLPIMWFIARIANSSVPPTINIIREVIAIISLLSHSYIFLTPFILINVLTLLYSITLYIQINHGHIVPSSKYSWVPLISPLSPIIMLLPTFRSIPISSHITSTVNS